MQSTANLKIFIQNNKTLKWILKILYLPGLDPSHDNVYSKVMSSLCLISFLFVIFGCFYELIFKWNGIDTVKKMDILPVECQILSKIVWLIVKRHNLLEILENLTLFWSSDHFRSEVQSKVENYQNKMLIITKVYLSSFVATTVLITIVKLREGALLYPQGYEFCSLTSTTCFQLYFNFQLLIICIFLLPLYLGCDLLFLSFITYIFCGYQLLEEAVLLIDFKKHTAIKIQQISRIVDQHSLILRFIKCLDDVYANILLMQISSSLLMMTASLFMMTLERFPPNFQDLSQYGSYYICMTFQCAIFAIGGAILNAKTNRFSDVIYQSKWYYDGQVEARRSLLLIIQRSNKNTTLTLGGLSVLGINTLASVVRNSISTYTLLSSLGAVKKD